jgi:hypothetical protein
MIVPNPIVSLGDQNNDGYDDFMICEWQGQLWVGNMIPSIHFIFIRGEKYWILFLLQIFNSIRNTYGPKKIIVKDINRDGYKDIIVAMTRIRNLP